MECVQDNTATSKQKPMQRNGKSWLLLEALLHGAFMSTMEIIYEFRMTRPAAIIHYLKSRLLVPIETILEKKIQSNGKVARYARYRIPPSSLQEQRERFGL